jgi:glutamyl-tRNA synthetase
LLRLALNPTRDMNLSDLRVALITYLLAKQEHDQLLVRIEDGDQERNIEAKDQELLKLLEIVGIAYDHLVYQSENLALHQKMAMQLLVKKRAFSCFCANPKEPYDDACANLSDDVVINTEAPFVVRLKRPQSAPFDSFIILSHDKKPTPTFATAIDDMIFDISTLVEEEDKRSEGKEAYVRDELDYDKAIESITIPPLINEGDDESFNLIWLIKEGFVPEAITHYLIAQTVETPSTLFSLEEATEWFERSKIKSGAITFDFEALKAINRAHLEAMDNLRLAQFIGYSDPDIGQIAKLYLDQATTTNEMRVEVDKIFAKRDVLQAFEAQQRKVRNAILELGIIEEYSELVEAIQAKSGLTYDELILPLTYLLSGSTQVPHLDKLYPHIKNYLLQIIK